MAYNRFLGAFLSGDDGNSGYNAAYKKSTLSKLYQSQDPEEQRALSGDLARVDPDAANDWQDQNQKKTLQHAKLLLGLGKDNPVAIQAWQRGIKPALVQMYGEQAAGLPDVPDDSVMQVAQYLVGATGGDTRWIQTVDESGNPVWAAATNQGITPTKYGIPDNYSLEIDPATGRPYNYSKRTGRMDEAVIPQAGATPGKEVYLTSPDGETIDYNSMSPDDKAAYQVFMADPSRGQTVRVQNGKVLGGGYVGMSAAEKAAAERRAQLGVDLEILPEIERAKAGVTLDTAPAIEGAKAEATATGKAAGERAGKANQKIVDSKEIINLLNIAEPIIKKSTGGYLGAQADDFYAAFGKSTEGSKAIAQLNSIAPKLIGMVPRFEGPQSDADRMLYEKAAGDLNNRLKPIGDRLAALQIMRDIAMQYSNVTPAKAEPARIRIKL